MNKWVLAAIAAVAVLVAGLSSSLDAGVITGGALVAAITAGVLAGVGKLYDPGSIIVVPRLMKALGLGLAAGLTLLSPAVADGSISGAEWGGIASAFLIAAWAKWSTPDKLVS